MKRSVLFLIVVVVAMALWASPGAACDKCRAHAHPSSHSCHSCGSCVKTWTQYHYSHCGDPGCGCKQLCGKTVHRISKSCHTHCGRCSSCSRGHRKHVAYHYCYDPCCRKYTHCCTSVSYEKICSCSSGHHHHHHAPEAESSPMDIPPVHHPHLTHR